MSPISRGILARLRWYASKASNLCRDGLGRRGSDCFLISRDNLLYFRGLGVLSNGLGSFCNFAFLAGPLLLPVAGFWPVSFFPAGCSLEIDRPIAAWRYRSACSILRSVLNWRISFMVW